MKIYKVLSLAIVILFSNLSFAAPPISGRVFIGASDGDLTNVNNELQALGLEEFGSIPMYGAEITYAVLPVLEVGLNYVKKQNIRETSGGAGTDYKAEFDQDVFLAVARVPFFKTSFLRLDVFGGIGGSNTTLNINSATQSGEITKSDDSEFVASVASRYGLSVSVGYKGVYFFVEGGYENNKVDSLKRTGTLSDNISFIDMSGPYGFVGLQFDSPKITKK